MLVDRMLRAARLDVGLFREVGKDTTATRQAFIVIVIVALATGVGAAGARADFLFGLIGGIISAIVGWLAWSAITYFIGTTFFGGRATWGELLRTIGFANSPGVLLVFAFIPILGGLLGLVVLIWVFAAGLIAIREALEVTTGRALLTVVIGWLVMATLRALAFLVGF